MCHYIQLRCHFPSHHNGILVLVKTILKSIDHLKRKQQIKTQLYSFAILEQLCSNPSFSVLDVVGVWIMLAIILGRLRLPASLFINEQDMQ